MEVKFINLDRLWKDIRLDVLNKLDNQYSTGIVRGGEITTHVEKRIAKLVNRKYCVLYSNATDALTQGLRNLSLSNADILVPAYTFLASASAIKLAGYNPVFVDVNEYYHMDLRHANKMFTKNTKAMVYVDLLGCPADKSFVETWCREKNIILIQDAAQCFGSEYENNPGGSMGFFSVLSFSLNKPCPVFSSGGALVTNNSTVYHQALRGRLHGKEDNTDLTTQLSSNSVMSSGDAHMLNVSLDMKDKWQQKRTRIAENYLSACGRNVPEFRKIHNWHKFIVTTTRRDELRNMLNSKNIRTMIHYNPLPIEEPIFDADITQYPNALRLRNCSLSLPMCPYMTDDEITRVVKCLKEFSF